jgi:hypothetical protein
MKRIFLLAAVTVFGLGTANAQVAKKALKKDVVKTEVQKTDGAGLVFESDVIDYGTIQKGADGKRDFVLTNNGTKPLTITNAQGSCGCTVPTKPDGPVAPGAKATIGVKYDTNRVGPFTKTITITSNASETPKVLTIKGNVVDSATTVEPVKS